MHRIHLILTGDFGQGSKMMDVNEPPCHFPIDGTEVDTTHAASGSVNLDTSGTSSRIPLVSIDWDSAHRAFGKALRRAQFIWV